MDAKITGMRMRFINRELPFQYDVTFFVPCLNEEGNIGPTIQNIIDVGARMDVTYEIIVFDDASKDGSVAEIKEMANKHPSVAIRVIENDHRRGLARNYVDGSYIGSGKYYMCVNGDNAEPAESLEKILGARGQADIVVPVFLDLDSRRGGRKALSRMFCFFVNTLSGNHLGYYNGPALHHRFNVMRWHADTDGFAYQAEIITRLIQEGASYVEVKIANYDRQRGRSTALNFKNFLAVSHSLFQILMRRIRFDLFYRSGSLRKTEKVRDLGYGKPQGSKKAGGPEFFEGGL